MEQADKEIEEIIGQMKRPKDFICYRSAFEVLCKARDMGIESFLECLKKSHTVPILAVFCIYAFSPMSSSHLYRQEIEEMNLRDIPPDSM